MTEQPCKTCGHVHRPRTPGHRPCTGHISGKARPERKGEPCTGGAMNGQDVCRMHGGSSPQARAAAEDRLAREHIATQIAHRAGHVQWLRARVQAIDPDALVWGRTKEKIGGDDHGLTREARPNIWLQLYLDAQAALERLCIDAIRAGLEERRVRLAERHGEALEALLDGILRDLGHDPDDRQTARIVARHLSVA